MFLKHILASNKIVPSQQQQQRTSEVPQAKASSSSSSSSSPQPSTDKFADKASTLLLPTTKQLLLCDTKVYGGNFEKTTKGNDAARRIIPKAKLAQQQYQEGSNAKSNNNNYSHLRNSNSHNDRHHDNDNDNDNRQQQQQQQQIGRQAGVAASGKITYRNDANRIYEANGKIIPAVSTLGDDDDADAVVIRRRNRCVQGRIFENQEVENQKVEKVEVEVEVEEEEETADMIVTRWLEPQLERNIKRINRLINASVAPNEIDCSGIQLCILDTAAAAAASASSSSYLRAPKTTNASTTTTATTNDESVNIRMKNEYRGRSVATTTNRPRWLSARLAKLESHFERRNSKLSNSKSDTNTITTISSSSQQPQSPPQQISNLICLALTEPTDSAIQQDCVLYRYPRFDSYFGDYGDDQDQDQDRTLQSIISLGGMFVTAGEIVQRLREAKLRKFDRVEAKDKKNGGSLSSTEGEEEGGEEASLQICRLALHATSSGGRGNRNSKMIKYYRFVILRSTSKQQQQRSKSKGEKNSIIILLGFPDYYTSDHNSRQDTSSENDSKLERNFDFLFERRCVTIARLVEHSICAQFRSIFAAFRSTTTTTTTTASAAVLHLDRILPSLDIIISSENFEPNSISPGRFRNSLYFDLSLFDTLLCVDHHHHHHHHHQQRNRWPTLALRKFSRRPSHTAAIETRAGKILNYFDSLDWLDEAIARFYDHARDRSFRNANLANIENALSEHFVRCLSTTTTTNNNNNNQNNNQNNNNNNNGFRSRSASGVDQSRNFDLIMPNLDPQTSESIFESSSSAFSSSSFSLSAASSSGFDLLELELSSFVVLGSALFHAARLIRTNLPEAILRDEIVPDLLITGLLTLHKYQFLRQNLIYFRAVSVRFDARHTPKARSPRVTIPHATYLLAIGHGQFLHCSIVQVFCFDRNRFATPTAIDTPTASPAATIHSPQAAAAAAAANNCGLFAATLPSSFAFIVFIKESFRFIVDILSADQRALFRSASNRTVSPSFEPRRFRSSSSPPSFAAQIDHHDRREAHAILAQFDLLLPLPPRHSVQQKSCKKTNQNQIEKKKQQIEAKDSAMRSTIMFDRNILPKFDQSRSENDDDNRSSNNNRRPISMFATLSAMMMIGNQKQKQKQQAKFDKAKTSSKTAVQLSSSSNCTCSSSSSGPSPSPSPSRSPSQNNICDSSDNDSSIDTSGYDDNNHQNSFRSAIDNDDDDDDRKRTRMGKLTKTGNCNKNNNNNNNNNRLEAGMENKRRKKGFHLIAYLAHTSSSSSSCSSSSSQQISTGALHPQSVNHFYAPPTGFNLSPTTTKAMDEVGGAIPAANDIINRVSADVCAQMCSMRHDYRKLAAKSAPLSRSNRDSILEEPEDSPAKIDGSRRFELRYDLITGRPVTLDTPTASSNIIRYRFALFGYCEAKSQNENHRLIRSTNLARELIECELYACFKLIDDDPPRHNLFCDFKQSNQIAKSIRFSGISGRRTHLFDQSRLSSSSSSAAASSSSPSMFKRWPSNFGRFSLRLNSSKRAAAEEGATADSESANRKQKSKNNNNNNMNNNFTNFAEQLRDSKSNRSNEIEHADNGQRDDDLPLLRAHFDRLLDELCCRRRAAKKAQSAKNY